MVGQVTVSKAEHLSWKKAKTSSLIAVMALVTALGASLASRAEAGDQTVVATVGHRKITEAELNKEIAPQLASIQNKIYELKKKGIQSIADDYLAEQEAKKLGISKEDYVKREIDDKAPAPSEEEVKKFYDDRKGQIHQPYDKIKDQISAFLRRQTLTKRRQEVYGKLEKDAGFKMLLPPPRVRVAADGSAATGPKNAPVTIVEFSDFQCPFCKRAEDSLTAVRKEYGDKVRTVYRDYPLPIHDHALKAAEAARCAEAQGKFWQYHDALFADQTKLDDAGLKATAAKLGLNTQQFNDCLDHDKFADAVKSDEEYGASLGVHGTPAFFINGRFLDGAQPPQAFEDVINDELSRHGHQQASAE
ncbi:MAG: thioredoxin domain-containing protein [Candidatus Binataceae bacterium]|jgi:protein-disulfide isomerase